MNVEQEMIADIVAEMRKYKDLVIRGRKYPDRIEEAMKRELGDGAKARSALRLCYDALSRAQCDNEPIPTEVLVACCTAVEDALSSPPRNFVRFHGEDEAWSYYKKVFPKTYFDTMNLWLFVRWLFSELRVVRQCCPPSATSKESLGVVETAVKQGNEPVTNCNQLNTAELRNAVKCLMDNLNIHLSMPSERITINRAELDGMVMVCEKALAAPVRQCDVGTAKEQSERYSKHCDPFRSCDQCPVYVKSQGFDHCEFAWGQMPYEEGGAK